MRNHQHIKTLDGWRAVAIVIVILSHLKDSIYSPNSAIFKVLAHGADGVGLFFAISGYIITVKLLAELEENGTLNLRSFYTRRVFRLMPASLVYLFTLAVLKALTFIQLNDTEFWATFFFWRNYYPVEGFHLTGHFWSLSVEEHFYLLFPAFLIYLRKPKKILWGILLVGLWVTIWRKIGTIDSVTNAYPWTRYSLHYTMGRLDGLLYGALIALLQRHYKTVARQLSKIPSLVPLLLLVIISILPVPLRPTWKSLLFPLLILSTMANEESFLSKLLENKIAVFVGQISYSLYVWHTLFVYANPHAPPWFQFLSGGWFSLIPVFIISWLSYKFIETPFRNFGIRLCRRQKENMALIS